LAGKELQVHLVEGLIDVQDLEVALRKVLVIPQLHGDGSFTCQALAFGETRQQSAVDTNLGNPDDAPSVGMILCRDKKRLIAEEVGDVTGWSASATTTPVHGVALNRADS
jgi:hypothetical protein